MAVTKEIVGFFKALGPKTTALLVFSLLVVGLTGFLLIRNHQQQQTIEQLENQIDRYREAGDASVPSFISPWDGIDFVPSTPSETPTERDYDKVVEEFRAELEGIEDEEVFNSYGDADARDRVVGEYSNALRDSLARRIAASRNSRITTE